MRLPAFLRNRFVHRVLCQLGYLRNGKLLTNLRTMHNGRFYIYTVDGFSLATQNLSWYLTRQHLLHDVLAVSCKFYQPRPGDVVVDIGAGLGEESTIYADMVGPGGRVYALEANPVVYEVLQQVLHLNRCRNTVAFNLALSEAPEPVLIDDYPDMYLASSLQNLSATAGQQYEVQGAPLEDFCASQGLRHIDFLKVNIEGAERFLASGFASPGLHIRHVAISCHDFRFHGEGNEFFRTKELVRGFLQANGYNLTEQHTGTAYVDDWVYGTKQ